MLARQSWAVLLLLLLALAGCARKEVVPASVPGASPAPVRQVLRIGNGGEPQDLDPQAISGVPEHKIVAALFEGLATEDPRDLHPVPGVAESWDISADGLVYTFHLRANARWSNGDPITSEDFLLSYQRMLSPAFASRYAYLIYNFVAGAKDYYEGRLTDFSQVGIKAPDPRTLQVTLRNPTPYLMNIIASHYAWTPVPARVIQRFGRLDEKGTAWTRPENLVGNGPFVLKEWAPHQHIVVARNPQYWDAATVKLDEIHFFPTEDVNVDERMFRTGQVDQTWELPNAKIDTYRRDHPQALHIEPYLGLYFYRFNVARPPFNDKRVRRALALAIDRESIVRNVMRGGQQPAYAVSYPGVAGYTPEARLTGTVEDARRLLAEAGFPGGKGFPTVELTYNTSQNHRAVAEAIQQMWRRNLGIDITLANYEWNVYLDLQQTRNFTLQRAGWIADYVDPHVFLEIWESTSGNNDTNWANPEYDRLLQAALSAPTQAARYAIYQRMDAILVDELPILPIYYWTTVRALNPKVRGYYPTLLDNHPYKYLSIGN
ncbi:peptide ABC transporter substrate-binding protein [Opitutus sp. ER46]|uniref:peptide ABC transporter substrate-binding protein n=1 Tax=Opitutus sp. ER46 TaxID=2161864 RepID=UPI000D312AEE|nr:peptide ABC transporter substrate-binding protein [Opitutus sp. ER46]PTX92546.1 peptide ABC transporter substrate-binding protein [Opitutus sp. ER46]